MKGLPEILGTPLEPASRMDTGKFPDFVGLWEKWSTKGAAVFLESAGPIGSASQWLILAGFPEVEFYGFNGKNWLQDESGTQLASIDFWRFADQVGNAGLKFPTPPSCLSQAWFGILSYDFGKRFDLKKSNKANSTTEGTEGTEFRKNFLNLNISSRVSPKPVDPVPFVPDFYFFKPSRVIAFNRQTRETFFFGNESWDEAQEASLPRAPFKIQGLQSLTTLAQYETKVRRVQGYISQGDIYQANIAQAFRAQWEGSTGTLYRTLGEMNPGPFMGLFQGRDFTVVSSSPERLVAGRGGWLETRPIAGTRPRGKGDAEDLRLRQELITNAKEQAEHLMLVDLARNDLGRVSRYGTVEVEGYAEIEPYARVQHLVSTVRSQRRPDASFADILKSLFPGGTITGCPKIRCMEIIDEIEARPRGFYTGSMGYLAPGPCFDFNILIRSFTLFPNGTMEFQAGAGIVADSDPRREYLETLYKVEALAQALGTSLVSNP